ncbi:ABC-type multidrug transport system, ATPase and permease component [Rubidibacter lacunae KORDI 51-2]|uniref:ABC-type multidrug transport system, ATPase and permease component n=1 Tax=Rubidibacter lacunae KORDI 51-2 TaxID=582515 RepID=U5DGG3_9CHRO|nr:ABC transporter ATP-binding protein [Rubidibacter lacunae]ERN40681.1 ABC-type multidrug transport system, ATPase and permease component [Rubidibacter lacunae KORDI 51-2]
MKLKFFFIKTYNYVRDVSRSLTLLWNAAFCESLFLAVLSILQGIFPAISISISKLVVDEVVLNLTTDVQPKLSIIIILVTSWIGVLMLSLLLNPWTKALQGNLNDKLTAHLSLLLMEKVNSFPDLSCFEDSRFYDELQILQKQLNYQPFNLLNSIVVGGRSCITLLTMLILLLPLGYWIPIILTIAIFPQILVSMQYETQIWSAFFDKGYQSRRMSYITSVLFSDTFAKEIRLFNLGNFFVSQYLTAFQVLHRSIRRLRIRQALWVSGLALLSTIGNGAAFYWIVRKAFRGQISPGSILLFLEALTNLRWSLEEFFGMWLNLHETMLYMQQLFSFLDSEPNMRLSFPGELVKKPLRSGIDFRNVSFFYPDNRLALLNITFTILPGETIAIVGENGAGKTTLIKLLLRMYDPVRGEILVDDINIKELNLDDWRRQVSGVFQDFGRYYLTLSENIALGDPRVAENHEELRIAIRKIGIHPLVERLPEKEHTPLGKQFGGTELSGGEWQKLAIARAIVRRNAQILILDEPTAALDPRSEYETYQHFTELARGKTTILVTHRLASVKLADRILVMKKGHLVEVGTHEELIDRDGEYASLWNMQANQYKA